MKRFLVLVNNSSPMTAKNYRKLSSIYRNSVKGVAETVIQEAALEIYNKKYDADCDDNIVETGISVGGTWQIRGFTSLNGAVTAISIETGRNLDVEVMRRYCQVCTNIEKFKEKADLYEHLKLDHVCKSNHEGSTGNMRWWAWKEYSRDRSKPVGCVIQISMRRDSKSFVSAQNIYAPKVVSKKECIGHVQKRVGTRLRNLKKTEKGLIKLGLTDKIIDRLQNYYGIAIRSNVGDLDTMKKWCEKSVSASLFCGSENSSTVTSIF